MQTAVIIVLVAFLIVLIFILHTIACVKDIRDDLEQEKFIKNYIDKHDGIKK